jgi:hypothetical protein
VLTMRVKTRLSISVIWKFIFETASRQRAK